MTVKLVFTEDRKASILLGGHWENSEVEVKVDCGLETCACGEETVRSVYTR